jgi:hypothetical protein
MNETGAGLTGSSDRGSHVWERHFSDTHDILEPPVLARRWKDLQNPHSETRVRKNNTDSELPAPVRQIL